MGVPTEVGGKTSVEMGNGSKRGSGEPQKDDEHSAQDPRGEPGPPPASTGASAQPARCSQGLVAVRSS